MEHIYKGFVLKRNGCKEMPWNIYYKNIHLAYDTTMKNCKFAIDDGCLDEEKRIIDKYGRL